MPKELAKIKEEFEEGQLKQIELIQWMKSIFIDVENKVLNFLQENADKTYTEDEIFEMAFGKKNCSLQKEGNCGGCGGCGRDLTPSHFYGCDYHKHFALLMEVLNKLGQEGKIVVYPSEKEQWIGIAPPEPPED